MQNVNFPETEETIKHNQRVTLVFAAANAHLRGEITTEEWEKLVDGPQEPAKS